MASSPTIDITGYENEDIVREFQLKIGTAASSTPYDITAIDFVAEIRDATNTLVKRLTTAESDHLIVKTDAVNGDFSITIVRDSIPFQSKQSLKYDLLMKTGSPAIYRRLWGGKVTILQGTTVP